MAVCAFLGAAPAQAGQFYLCEMKTKYPNGWVSPSVGLIFDDAGGVQVIDGIIHNFIGEPVKASLRKRGDKFRITWHLSNLRDSLGQVLPKMRYLAEFDNETKEVTVAARPVGPPQRWSAKGTCKIRTSR